MPRSQGMRRIIWGENDAYLKPLDSTRMLPMRPFYHSEKGFMNIPEYKGEPLSVIRRITQEDAHADLWHYIYKLNPLQNNVDTINRLTEQGYKQVDSDSDVETGFLVACLASQLHDMAGVQDGEQIHVWAHQESIEYVKKYPVLLCFLVEKNEHPDANSVQMLQFLPLPRHGERAIIGFKNASLYRFEDLDETAQQLKSQLGQTIFDLAGKSQWGNHTPIHTACANELQYLALRTELQTRILTARGEQEKEIQSNLENLEKAHTNVLTLRQSWLRPDWLHQWQEIRGMAKDLAAIYYAHVQDVSGEKKPAQAVKMPSIPNAFNSNDLASMYTAFPMQAYNLAMTTPVDKWNTYPSEKENEVIMGVPYKVESGTYHVMIRENIGDHDREQAIAHMKKGIADMSDDDSDLFMMMLAQLIVSPRNQYGNAVMTAEKALEYHGSMPKKKAENTGDRRTGGQRWEDIERWGNSYLRMKNKWMKLDEVEIVDDTSKPDRRGRRRRSRISREGPLFMWGEIITHTTMPYGDNPAKTYIIGWEYRESTWMQPFIQGSNAYTGQLLQDCFTFDPYHETWEKRLSKHFFFWLRMNGKYPDPHPVTIRDLFETLHLEIDERNPQRTREHFERAMNVLAGKQPRTIGKKTVERAHLKWKYIDNNLELPARNWLQTWLAQEIKVTLSDDYNPNPRIVEAARERRVLLLQEQIKNTAKNTKKTTQKGNTKNGPKHTSQAKGEDKHE